MFPSESQAKQANEIMLRYLSHCTKVKEETMGKPIRKYHIVPKHHLFLHLTHGIRHKGNPRFYQTYLDESLNKTICSIAASSHRSTMERRVAAKFHRSQKASLLDSQAWW